MSETKLLPCPCCGSDDIIKSSCGYTFGVDNYIKCRTCGLKMQLCSEIGWEELEKRWNTRKPIERIVERLEDMAVHYAYDPSVDGAVKAFDYLYAVTIVKEEAGL